MDIKQFEVLVRYNIWATERLTHALKNISDQDFSRPCGLFFNSICGTLNHLLVGEHYFWYRRFTNLPIASDIQLSTVIETDKNKLLNLLNQSTRYWNKFLNQFVDKDFPKQLDYLTSIGKAMSLPYAETLMHVFHHGTHHRGQVTAILTSMSYPCPELDMVYMIAEEAGYV